jgi:YVTN family beta-propeller protein
MISLRRVLLAASAVAFLLAGTGLAAAQTAIVLNSAEDTISVISTGEYRETSRQPIGREPHHLMLTPDRTSLLVANAQGNELVFVDPVSGAIQRRLPGISDPYQIGFSPDRKWFVATSLRLDRIDIYDGTTFKLAGRLPAPSMPSHISFSADSSRVYITLQGSDKLTAIDLATQKTVWTAVVGPTPAGVLTLPSGQLLTGIMGADYVALTDPASGRVLQKIKTAKGAHTLFWSPDGKTIFVSNRIANTISLLDPATLTIRGTYKAPGGPDDIVFSQDGKEIWVTGRFHAQIDVLDIATGELKHVIPVGRSPHGIYLFNPA